MNQGRIYREKAAQLRAAARATSNFAVSVELNAAADRYDRLADIAKPPPPPPSESPRH